MFRLLSGAPLLFATCFAEKIHYYVDAEPFYSVLLLFALLSCLVFIMFVILLLLIYYVLTSNALVIMFSCCRALFCLLYECVYLDPAYTSIIFTHTMLLIYICTTRVCYGH